MYSYTINCPLDFYGKRVYDTCKCCDGDSTRFIKPAASRVRCEPIGSKKRGRSLLSCRLKDGFSSRLDRLFAVIRNGYTLYVDGTALTGTN